jgi:hypothetical protein
MADFFAPSYWYGAGPDFSGLANAQASQAQTNNYLANQQNTLAQANAYNPYANSGGSFGAQPAAYAGLGAAYGRATGGFGGGAGGQEERLRALYPQAFRGGGIGGENARDSLARAMRPPTNPYAGMILGPQANPEYFNPGHYRGLGGTGVVNPPTPMPNAMKLLGYDPATSGQWAPNANSYRPLGGAMQFPNSGTPSQYAPDAQMPPGFSQPYSVDNPGGALPSWMNPNPGS